MFVRNTKPKHIQRGGFTLVEMLTVIVIIGILAGMIVGASVAVRNAARRAMIVTEIKQLETAVQNYKSEVGEYPPDFAFCDRTDSLGSQAKARVVRHLRKAYPRMQLVGATMDLQYDDFVSRLSPFGIQAADLNPSTALPFWLGGLPIDGQPKGFHSDPANPFKQGEPRTKPYFDFDKNRLVGYQFCPAKIQPAAPYVYFRALKDNSTGFYEYGGVDPATSKFTPFTVAPAAKDAASVCVPYLEDACDPPDQPINPVNTDPTHPTVPARAWRSPETYQIISAGLDGVYSTADGDPPVSPSPFRVSKLGVGFSNGDHDNLASFAEGTLGGEL